MFENKAHPEEKDNANLDINDTKYSDMKEPYVLSKKKQDVDNTKVDSINLNGDVEIATENRESDDKLKGDESPNENVDATISTHIG